MPMIPMYDTKTFSQIWEEASDFKADYIDNGISPTIHYGETSGGSIKSSQPSSNMDQHGKKDLTSKKN